MKEVTYVSNFYPEVSVSLIYKESEKYDILKPIFDEYGFGFMVPNQNLVIIDGENLRDSDFGGNMLPFIEAHEIAHVMLGHDGPRNEQDEMDADYGAYVLLMRHQLLSAAKLLKDTFEERHNQEFNIDRVKELENELT